MARIDTVKIRTYLGTVVEMRVTKERGGLLYHFIYEGAEYIFWEFGDGILPGNRRTRLIDWIWEIKALKKHIKARKARQGY